MTPLREDTRLVVPEPPAVISGLGDQETELAIAGPVRSGQFLIEGDQVTVIGSQRGPIERVRIGPRVVASNIRTEIGSPVNLVSLPGVLRREFAGPEGTTLEAVVAAPTLPLVAIQWGPSNAQYPDSISLDLHGPGEKVASRVGSSSVVIGSDNGDVVAIGVSPRPAHLEIVESVAGGVHVRVRLTGPAPVTLLVAAGPPAAVDAAFAAAAYLNALTRRGGEAGFEDGLVLATGVTEVDDGVQWAGFRLRSSLSRVVAMADEPQPVALWSGLAALGIGDEVSATRALEIVATRNPAEAGLLAGRIAMVFGDARRALDHARTLLDAGSPDQGRASAHRPANGLRSTALGALADALRHAASDALIAELRAEAEATRGPATGALGPWLESLLMGEPSPPPPIDPWTDGEALYILPSLFRSDPDPTWTRWWSSISEGLEGGPAGPGSWDAPDRDDGLVAPVTSSLLCALAHGLLGLAPDAPAGRIRIAPRLPSHLKRFRVEGVTVGSARLALAYERDGPSHRYTLEPLRASVPPIAVFEPAIPGTVTLVRIDDEVADLETRRSGRRTIVPVQLPIDATRVIEIFTR